MYVPVDAATAAWAEVVLGAARPWRLFELSLVDLPNASWTSKEGQRHWAAHGQQLGRPDDRHADRSAAGAVVARAGAAETSGGEAAICLALKVDQPSRGVMARAVPRSRPPCAPWKQSLASQGLPPPQPFPAQSLGLPWTVTPPTSLVAVLCRRRRMAAVQVKPQ